MRVGKGMYFKGLEKSKKGTLHPGLSLAGSASQIMGGDTSLWPAAWLLL